MSNPSVTSNFQIRKILKGKNFRVLDTLFEKQHIPLNLTNSDFPQGFSEIEAKNTNDLKIEEKLPRIRDVSVTLPKKNSNFENYVSNKQQTKRNSW